MKLPVVIFYFLLGLGILNAFVTYMIYEGSQKAQTDNVSQVLESADGSKMD